MTARARLLGLPLGALVLVAVVLVGQIANGGGRFAPSPLADPCKASAAATRTPATLDALGQDLVLQGLSGAACRLGISREALTLELARDHNHPTDAQISALRAGLLDAIAGMKKSGTLPPSADLVGQALDTTDLNSLAKLAIRAVPDSVINGALPTDEVLRQAVENLDVRALLTDLDDTDQLSDLVTRAVTKAVQQTLTARLRSLV